ncbi:MAG: MaoC family dehydratase [Candidatus Rokubacteria bacterium]|nr:MaoC family dehydratase [Candidatus Rokubacteria bacterium]
MIGRTVRELRVGDAAQLTRRITPETIREFVDATGDDNPIHSDETFAAASRFGQVIAPGMLTGGLLSAVIGTRLPGPGAIYVSQSFRFVKPVYVGDTITARVEVAEVLSERNRLRLRTVCLNQDGELVLGGEAWVIPSQVHIERPEEPELASLGALACAQAALAFRAMAFWTAAGLAVASQALQLYRASFTRGRR